MGRLNQLASLHMARLQSRWESIDPPSKKMYILTAVCICCLCSTFFVILPVSLYYGGAIGASFPCITLTCIDSAIKVLLLMDQSVDPCENFYFFTCGQQILNQTSSNKMVFTKLTLKQKEIDDKLIDVFNNKRIDEKISISRKAFKYYEFCLHSDKRSKRNNIRSLLKYLGGWPIQQKKWIESGFLLNSVALATKISKHNLFEFDVKLDETTKVGNIMTLKPVVNGEQSSSPLILRAIYSGKFSNAEIRQFQQLDSARNFSMGKDPYHSIEIMTVSELSKKTKFDKWINFFNIIMNDTKNVTKSDKIAVYNIDYFINLFNIIKKENIGERIISNYIIPGVIDQFSKFMAHYGLNKESSSPEKCISLIKDVMPFYIDHLFIKYNFNNKEKNVNIQQIKVMMEYITDATQQLSDKASWIDEITRQSFVEKLQNMKFLIGYNPKIEDINFINDYYKTIPEPNIESKHTVLQLALTRNLNNFLQINIPANRTSWPHYSISNVSIYNQQNNNVIVIPLGALQEPLFQYGIPSFINYASIGSVISDKIIHGLIGEGSHRDKYGIVNDWWTDQAKGKFEIKFQCFKKQHYELNISEINDQITLDERIKIIMADNMALRVAYRAYRNWEKKNGKERTLLRLHNFTIPQLFFISYNNLWCTTHLTSNAFRVIFSLRNTEEFSESFICTADSVMNPNEKCDLW